MADRIRKAAFQEMHPSINHLLTGLSKPLKISPVLKWVKGPEGKEPIYEMRRQMHFQECHGPLGQIKLRGCQNNQDLGG